MAKELKATIEFLNYRAPVENRIQKFVENSVAKSLAVMERNIKANTPVKEGHLRRSIHSINTGLGRGEVRTGAVEGGREINYAVHVEFGTRFMAPRAMFRKGVAQSEDQIKDIFKHEAWRVEREFPLK